MLEEIHKICQSLKIEGLPSVTALATELQESQRTGTLVLRDESPDATDLVKRRHDINAALRTLSLTIDALKDGYQFEDASAPAKIKAVEKAINAIKNEADFWQKLLLK